ncbi:hypothetical protein GSI_11606 [Ganoderma sinense ZZ0214-1]|uniref:Nudix hydrolase domain-containing protein n=1 Tax=Ganoderma sinense ZZ0214-1 TaxID=1077348 RepID=A0A2G8RWG2_9APHY|nr:hypothetical protein GSI_11606 [Ganoderma sinense ZZ0214-1]
MAGKRWSLSRVWGGTRQDASASGPTTAGPSSNRSTNGTQHNRSQSTSNARPASSSHSRRAQPASREAQEIQFSTPIVEDSAWFAPDFMLGAGMVIIQPSTKKIVVLSDKEVYRGKEYRYWFLPKGRKDVGESLEQTALREAYEESGLRVSFLPIVLAHNAPGPPNTLADLDRSRLLPCTEPIYICTQAYEKRASTSRPGGKAEYLTFWYVGQVSENAVVEPGTRMADEVNYETHFLSIKDAISLLPGPYQLIVHMAHRLWLDTVEMQSQDWYQERIAKLHALASARNPVDATATARAGPDHSQGRPAPTTQAPQDTDSWEDSD